jgi:hypothetical protein
MLQDITERIHRVYDTFLAEFPLCYGYWKKYADHEARLGSHESIVAVYERAVQAVTYSVDIWTHYCSYLISKQENPEEIRRYNNATAQCLPILMGIFVCSLTGMHCISLPIWKSLEKILVSCLLCMSF